MPHVIVAQSRGDAHRLAEWVTYHSRLGFDEIHVVLDGLVDDSVEVLESLDVEAEVHHHLRPEQGEYYDGLSIEERWQRILRWREENAEMLASLPFAASDVLSWRQGINLGPLLEEVTRGRKGWVACIDVDEFIHVPGSQDIRTVTRDAPAPRLSLLNHNVSTAGHDPSRPFLEQHRMRWSREDLEAYPVKAWTNRVKTIARFRAATPYEGIHYITKGRRHVLPPEVARLHHFRIPEQPLQHPLPYRVDDPITMPPPRTERAGTERTGTEQTGTTATPPEAAGPTVLGRLRGRLSR